MKAYTQLVQLLPGWLQTELHRLPPGTGPTVQEIRLRAGCPVQLVCTGGGRQTLPLCLTRTQLEAVLFTLCGGALYAHEQELARGYLALPGGHRAGVGGKFVRLETGETVLQTVQSLNLRVARFDTGQPPPALLRLVQGNFSVLLLAGEPGSGKTTLLRQLAGSFARAGRLCVVIDERGEILPEGQVSGCDVVQGLPKLPAMEMALRTLGPQVLLVDELVSLEEAALLGAGAHAGVNLVVTLHAASLAELEEKPQTACLRRQNLLHYACILQGRSQPGCIREVKCYC